MAYSCGWVCSCPECRAAYGKGGNLHYLVAGACDCQSCVRHAESKAASSRALTRMIAKNYKGSTK